MPRTHSLPPAAAGIFRGVYRSSLGASYTTEHFASFEFNLLQGRNIRYWYPANNCNCNKILWRQVEWKQDVSVKVGERSHFPHTVRLLKTGISNHKCGFSTSPRVTKKHVSRVSETVVEEPRREWDKR